MKSAATARSADEGPDIHCLVQRARDGDSVAFSEIYGRYHAFLVGYLLTTGANYHDCWDLAQETFLNALRGLNTLDLSADVRFGGWLITIARNVARKHGHKMHRIGRTESPDELIRVREEPTTKPQEKDLGPKEVAALVTCLDALDVEQRQMVAFKFVLNHANRKIATLMGCSDGTVRNRLKEALTDLRECLEAKGVTVG